MKIYVANFRIKPMNISANLDAAMQQLDCCISKKCDVIVFPSGFLFGTKPGVIKNADWARRTYNDSIAALYQKASQHGIAVVADKICSCDGNFVPSILKDTSENCCKTEIAGLNCRTVKNSAELFGNVPSICNGTDIVFINWMEKGVAGQKYLWTETLKAISAKYGTAFVFSTAGSGYSTHPDFYMPMIGVIKNGVADIYHNFDGIKNAPCVFDVEKAVLNHAETDDTEYAAATAFPVCYNQNPLVPANVPEKEYCLDLFDMQCESLANRLVNINCKNIVLNLSGGLDSTAALLVCARTFNMLGLDKKGMHIITQPGFGTSSTTKGLAHDLCKGLGLELKTVDITDTCRAALLSVGHDGVTPDVTFENVQARTRTMNALNMANHLGAIMVGTGDLSEEALGFSTYGGDQLASYNVNCCVSKTVMRTMLPYVTGMEMFSGVRDAVDRVLNVPVSPELIPHGGKILQKTEDILAPYKLIDFFIYCTVVTKVSPAEVAALAYDTFRGEFDKEYIAEKLKMFYRKFAVGQFKRSCAPECADITHVSLLSSDTFYPSDGSTDIFVQNF